MSEEQCTTPSRPHEGSSLTRCISAIGLVAVFLCMLVLSDRLDVVQAASNAHASLGYLTRLVIAFASTGAAYLAPDFARRRTLGKSFAHHVRARGERIARSVVRSSSARNAT